MTENRWLRWAQELQAIAQSGLAFSPDVFDRERYERLRAIAAGMMAAAGDVPRERLATLFEAETGYATPKCEVRGVVLREGRILMVKEWNDGRWSLPGGWADVGRTPRAAVEDELREETGFETRATKLLAVYDRDTQGHPVHLFAVWRLFFRCEIAGGEARPSHETPEVGFFAPDALPELSPHRLLPHQVARMVALYDADAPTEFD